MTPFSLQQYLSLEQREHGLDPALARLIFGISDACAMIGSKVRSGALAGVLGLAGTEKDGEGMHG